MIIQLCFVQELPPPELPLPEPPPPSELPSPEPPAPRASGKKQTQRNKNFKNLAKDALLLNVNFLVRGFVITY